MKKQNNPVLAVFVIVIPLLLIGFSVFLSRPHGKNEPVTELNQPYKGSRVQITALDIRTFEASQKEQIVVMEFLIDNISKQSDYFVNTASYEAYVDNLLMSDFSLYEYGTELRGTIAPGKSVKGYWGAVVPTDAESVEIRIEDDAIHDVYATFILDLPPTEKQMTLEEYMNLSN